MSPSNPLNVQKDVADTTAAKKRHTQKAQVIADLNMEQLLATDFSMGNQHNFQLFKESRTAIACQTRSLADAGYQGLASLHANS